MGWEVCIRGRMCTGGKHPFDAQNEGALIRKIMKGVWTPLPGGKFSSQLGDLLHSCLTMDHRTRPDTAGLLRNPALVGRARSLGIELDPDAKNLSVRSVVGIQGMTTAKQMHAGGAARARAPLAEMALPTAPPSWERQPEQHMLERFLHEMASEQRYHHDNRCTRNSITICVLSDKWGFLQVSRQASQRPDNRAAATSSKNALQIELCMKLR